MSRTKKIWLKESANLKQLKIWTLLMVLYLAAIILYILVRKDTNDLKYKNVNRLKLDSPNAKTTASTP
ncbi:hypothetical protein [Emticicia soli]|uniref:Uncharacterized protein n=1 Tax=Emticicia soli TaxID=2027878 RepID=A0ABW5JDZ3_9BACT